MNESECEEIIDDEIQNRKLPFNGHSKQGEGEEEGKENCKEEDEERKEGFDENLIVKISSVNAREEMDLEESKNLNEVLSVS